MDQQSRKLESWIENDSFDGVKIPQALRLSLERHRENLGRLILSLKSAGVSEEQIETSVSVVVSSYKEELLHAIKMMVR